MNDLCLLGDIITICEGCVVGKRLCADAMQEEWTVNL